MKRILLAVAALAIAIFLLVSVPPARLTLAQPFPDRTVSGILHVHTTRSDGGGTPEEIAAAAARAGLAFVILTDHGDATRAPDAPTYRSGVLCIDAVEISTNGGHYVAVGMPASPYPLNGEPRDVVEDVRRLGGFGVVAHPNSPNRDLAWNDWNASFDSLEWMNLDTTWRLKAGQRGFRARWHLVEALAAYPFRPAETIARLTAGTALETARWASLSRTRKVVLLAGTDAHAKFPVPGYESLFRTMSIHVSTEHGLTGDAAADASAIIQAIRRSRVYMTINGIAGPPALQFTATNSRGTASYGDTLEAGGPVTLRIVSNAPESFTTILLQDERPLASAPGNMELTRSVPDAPAVYRVEIHAPSERHGTAWLASNPIYVGMTYPEEVPRQTPPVTASHALFDGGALAAWHIEADTASRGSISLAIDPREPALTFRYALAPRPTLSQVVALVAGPLTVTEAVDQLSFMARADRPTRIEVAVRPRRGPQWTRSVYLDTTAREYAIPFDEMTPPGAAKTPQLVAADIQDVLFIVETTHNKPGSEGSLTIARAALQQAGARRR